MNGDSTPGTGLRGYHGLPLMTEIGCNFLNNRIQDRINCHLDNALYTKLDTKKALKNRSLSELAGFTRFNIALIDNQAIVAVIATTKGLYD